MSYIKKNEDGSSFLVHDDGTVEEISNTGPNPNPNPNPIIRKLKRWLLWILIILVIWVIVYNIVVDGDNIFSRDKDATYLNVSRNDLYFSSEGESQTIEIETDATHWGFDYGEEDNGWITLYKDDNNPAILKISVDVNKNIEQRSSSFTVQSGNIAKRVYISQDGTTDPVAQIENSQHYIEYAVLLASENPEDDYKYDDCKDINGIHILPKVRLYNLDGEKVYCYAFLYNYKHTSPLCDSDGKQLGFYSTDSITSDDAEGDFDIFIRHDWLKTKSNKDIDAFACEIVVYMRKGVELDRKKYFLIDLSE